jgi:uncharacterized protein involved in exopolysaccharide biosynthesis
MDFWKTTKVLLRRWRVAVPVFAVSLGVAAGMFLSVRTDYESTGTIVLTSPTEGARVPAGATGPADQVNPLLAFDASLNTSATIIIQKLQDPTLQEQLLGDTTRNSYDIGNGKLTGPFIVVVALAPTPDEAKAIVTKVMDRARTELRQSQETLKAPASTFITPVTIIDPSQAQPKIGGKVRFAAVALVLGFLASLASAYWIESFSQSRKKKRIREQAKEAWRLQGSPEPDVPDASDETAQSDPITVTSAEV